jgi:sec-independent protein translocase protein TatA
VFASPLKDGLIVLVLVLLFFGPKRLPALSRSIGESIKEFKGGIGPSSVADEKPDTSTSGSSLPAAPPEHIQVAPDRTATAPSESTNS